MFAAIRNKDGFTLIELLMSMIILGILTQMSMAFVLDLRERAYDATALSDGKNLMGVVGNSFLALEDVTFQHSAADGSQIGVLAADGVTPRPAVFTLSPGVRAVVIHDHPGIPSGGFVTARIYHSRGTDDSSNPSGKREFWFALDEMTSLLSAPSL